MDPLFDVRGKVVVITGGAGILCRRMAEALAERGAWVAILDRDGERAVELADTLSLRGYKALGVMADVLDKSSLEKARETVIERYGRIDALVNGAGGNRKDATTDAEQPFFDIPMDALRWVFDLNFMGAVHATQVFGSTFAAQKAGIIINISSMASIRPLTKVVAYSAAKAALNNFTQWMAVHFAQHDGAEIRVNAIAPGFFLTEQNRYLLQDEAGASTERGRKIIEHTPMARYGVAEDLIGTLIWLLSDGSRFVNGAVIPVDGGFSAYAGV